MSRKDIYLDYAAASPLDSRVLEAMSPYFSDLFYNPSANYLLARKVNQDILKAREIVAGLLEVKPAEIYFTAGGTEANNLAIKGVMDKFSSKNVVISSIEHESVVDPAKGYLHKIAPVDNQGFIKLGRLSELIDDDTVLISIMYVNNEIGAIQPLRKISSLIKVVRSKRLEEGNQTPLYFHTDACQVANYENIKVNGLGVDLMTLNGGKIYGPKQSGILYIHRSIKLNPQILGGGQEFGLRSGTENVANIIGFSKALEIAQNLREIESKRLHELQQYFFDSLMKIYPKIHINGPQKNRVANNVNVSFVGFDNEELLFKLDNMGVMCSTGSACNAKKNNISVSLLAIGLSKSEALSSLRFSLGRQTDLEQIKRTIEIIKKALV
ncbi:MAG TPA: cysteine desulfurase family protein [Candidatus Saccharimonadia bacterium]|nr:cysteine desulfurase family protein [Candidatus Saccharimonadia bacterium]